MNTVRGVFIASGMGIRYLRVGGNGSMATHGYLANQRLDAVLRTADMTGEYVDFVFNPDQVPPYDRSPAISVSVKRVHQHKRKVLAALRHRLEAILAHPSVRFLEIGNEPNLDNWPANPHAFWHGTPATFAIFLRLTLRTIAQVERELERTDVEVILPAIATPDRNRAAFTDLLRAYAKQRISVRGMIIAVHAYSSAALVSGIEEVRAVGARPMLTEVGVNVRAAGAPTELAGLVSGALGETTGLPVLVHQLDGGFDATGIDYTIEGTALEPQLRRWAEQNRATECE